MRVKQNKAGVGREAISAYHYDGPPDVLEAAAPERHDDPQVRTYYQHRAEDMGPARYRKDWT